MTHYQYRPLRYRSGLIALAAALALFFLAGTAPAQAPGGGAPAMPVVMKSVSLDTVEVTIESIGSIRARESTDVTADISGIAREIHFNDGDLVSAGDLLVTLDKDAEQSTYELARVRYEGADRDLKRAERLARSDAISAESVDQLRTAFLSAQAQLRSAEVVLEKRHIRAPFSGRLGLRQISPGALVQPGTVITHIATTGSMEIEFTVPENRVGAVHDGQRVWARAAGDRNTRIPARITSVDSRIDPSTRSVTVIARTENGAQPTRPGQFVNIDLVIERRSNPTVPEEAVILEGARTYVFTVEDGAAAMREITVGQRGYGTVEVLDGLHVGDVVITEGTQKVRSGAPVVDIEVMRRQMQQQQQQSQG